MITSAEIADRAWHSLTGSTPDMAWPSEAFDLDTDRGFAAWIVLLAARGGVSFEIQQDERTLAELIIDSVVYSADGENVRDSLERALWDYVLAGKVPA